MATQRRIDRTGKTTMSRADPFTRIAAGMVLAVLLASLSACGFRLRGEVELPPELTRLRLDMDESGPRIRRELVSALERGGVTFVPPGTTDVAVLRVPVNQASTEALSISEQARVTEYAVRHRVELEITAADGAVLMPRQEILLERDFVFDRLDALGVAGQEEALMRDLEREMVRAILRRIESLDADASRPSR